MNNVQYNAGNSTQLWPVTYTAIALNFAGNFNEEMWVTAGWLLPQIDIVKPWGF